MNFETVRLGDICRTNRYTYSLKENWSFVNYLDTGNITKNKIDEIQYIDLLSEKLPSRAKRKVKYNSIIFSTVRPNQLHYGIIKHQPDNFLVSTGFTVIDINEKKANANFLFYLLTQSEYIQHLQAIAEQSTSAYPSIKPSDIEDLIIKIPDVVIQQKISSILSAIDDKIELNNKINANLEQQAQAIFKSWFVDFAPFGGVMPDDWHIGKLFEISDITMGQSPKGTSYNEKGIGMLFFQGRTDFGNRFPKIRMYTTEPKRTAEKGDILLSVRAPVGDLNIATQKCCIGRGLASIRSKFNHSSFLFYTVFNLKSQFDMFNGEGTVFGSINQKALKEMSVIIPKQKIIDEFERIVSPIDNVIKNNFDEICYLSELRDTLLPKLMNGEIDVSQTKI